MRNAIEWNHLKKPEDVWDAQSVCVVTKGGTVLKTFADRSAGLSMYMKRKQWRYDESFMRTLEMKSNEENNPCS